MRVYKSVAGILAFCLIFAVLPFNAAALSSEEGTVLYMEPVLHNSDGGISSSMDTLEKYVDIEQFKACVLEGIFQCQKTIDISRFNLSKSIYTSVGNYIFYFLPEAFNVDGVGFSLMGTKLTSINVNYLSYADTKAEYTQMHKDFLSSANAILNGIEGNSSLTAVQKALLLHDRLALITEYSYKDYSRIKHTAYSALVQGSSVCQGYTMAYMYLLDRVGIKSTYCSSDKLNHAWNIVYIASVPYHVDVTWDDISWYAGSRGVCGAVKHENFLRSTNGIKSTGHDATDFDTSPTDTRYDSYFWQSSQTAFQLVGYGIFYIDNTSQTIKKYGESKNYRSVESVWRSSSSQYWKGNFSCLASVGNDLLYSLPDGVYRYSIGENTSVKVYSPTLKNYAAVYGMEYKNNYIVCDINKAPPGGSILNLTQSEFLYKDDSAYITGIEIVNKPSETKYYIGDTIDTKGLTVRVKYSNNTSQIIDSGFQISGFSSESAGTVNVNVAYKGYSDDFSVTVAVPSVSLSQNISLYTGKTVTLNADTEPSGQTVSFRSKNPEKATVTSGGAVTAIKYGTAVINAEFTYNGRTYSADCEIEILCSHIHTTVHPAVSSTCVFNGNEEYEDCNDCGSLVRGSDAKLDFSEHTGNGASCTDRVKCSVCGEFFNDPDKHTYVQVPLEKNIVSKANCISAAVYVEACENCNAKGTKTFTAGNIDALVHINTSAVKYKAPTCTENGFYEGVYCNDCKKYISGHGEIPATAHKNRYTVGLTAPTCTSVGFSSAVYCPDCSTYLEITDEIPAKGHNEIKTAAVAPTYESYGFTEGVYCNDCRKYLSGHERLDKLTAVFKDSSNAVLKNNDILAIEGITASVLLKQAGEGAVIKDRNGRVLRATDTVGTGMMLVFGNTKAYTIVVSGDADGDGAVTAADARLALRASVKLERLTEGSAEYKAANVDGESITASDARLILRASVRLEDIRKWIK